MKNNRCKHKHCSDCRKKRNNNRGNRKIRKMVKLSLNTDQALLDLIKNY